MNYIDTEYLKNKCSIIELSDNDKLQKYTFIIIDNVESFINAFKLLLNDKKICFNIQKQNVDKISILVNNKVDIIYIEEGKSDFIISNNDESFILLLNNLFESYFYTGKSFTYSTKNINENFNINIKNICNIFDNRLEQKIRPIDCLDIINIIGMIVMSCNIKNLYLPKGSAIHTDKGFINIENINIGDKILSLNGNYENIIKHINIKKEKCITIITEDGNILCCKNNKFTLLSEKTKNYKYIQANDLKIGDSLLNIRFSNIGSKTNLSMNNIILHELDNNLAWFYGIISVDAFQYKDIIIIIVKTSEIAEKIKEQFLRFDDTLNISITKELIGDYTIRCISKLMTDIIYSKFSRDIIPDFIKNGTLSVRNGYIAGIIDNYKEKDNFYIYSTTNELFIKQLQLLCYSCGFETCLKKTYNYNNDLIYTLKAKSDFSKSIISKFSPLFNTNFKFIDHNDENIFNIVKIIDIKNDEYSYEIFNIATDNENNFNYNGYLINNSIVIDQIAIGDNDDIDYLNAKRWDINIPEWRSISNNFIITNSIDNLPVEFWYGYEGKGDPYGIINISNENNSHFLYEIYLNNIENYKELVDVVKKIYVICNNKKFNIGFKNYSKDKETWISKIYEIINTGCRPSNTLITTDKGIFTLAELMVDHPKNIELHNLYGLHTACSHTKIIKTYRNKLSIIIKFTLSYNQIIECTPNQKLWVKLYYDNQTNTYIEINKWVEARYITTHHVLDVKLALYNNELIGDVIPNLAYIIGNYWAGNDSIIEYENVKEFFEYYNIVRNEEEDKNILKDIPFIVRSSSYESIIAFIAGFISFGKCLTKNNTNFSIHFQEIAASVGIHFNRIDYGSIWNLKQTHKGIKERVEIYNKYITNKNNNQIMNKSDILGRVDNIEYIDKPVETFDIELEDSHYYYSGSIKNKSYFNYLN